jgi:hypothetical protein
MAVTLNASTSSGFVQSADTSGEITLQSNGTTKLTVASTGVSGTLVQGTAVASTSGTSIDFTGIPSWAKKITVMFAGVSTNSTSNIQIQIGSGSFTTSGYSSSSVAANGAIANVSTGFLQAQAIVATNQYSGQSTIFVVSGNLYMATGNFVSSNSTNNGMNNAGTVTLGGVLDRIRITTVNGTDTFDAGTINIQYEG